MDNHTKCCCCKAAGVYIYIYIYVYVYIYIYTHAYTQEIDSQYVAFYIHLASWLLPVSPLAICFIHFTCLLVQKLWGNNINKWGTQVSTRASLAIVVLFWWGGISQLWELATSLIGVSLPHSTFAPGIAIRSCVEGFTSAAFWKHLGLCWHIKTEPALKQIGQFFHLASISNLPFITAKNAGSRTDPINLSHTNFKNRSTANLQLRSLAACHKGSRQQIHVHTRRHRSTTSVATNVGSCRIQGHQWWRACSVRSHTWDDTQRKIAKKLFVEPCLKYRNSEFSFSDSLLRAALLAALQQVQMYSATTSGVRVNLIYSDSPNTFSVSAL